jgi:hypothetical protein
MNPDLRSYLAEIGRRGGRKSRRSLSSEEARRMVRVREARRAYRRFHAQCFWSYSPQLQISADDVAWVAEQLMRYGGAREWSVGVKLCR